MRHRSSVLLVVVLALVSGGCGSDDPVLMLPAPHLLLLTAVPDEIPADGSSSSQLIAVIVPVPETGADLGGIEVAFTTTLGGLGGTDETARTTTTTTEGAAGMGLRGTETAGVATVTANVPSLQIDASREVRLIAR